ncbi:MULTISPECIES: NAD(P)/FAD-dependent oxidoreductase [Reichenbachiella]|uniref:NADH:ubiquinone reductase (non-electrogenic) n=1 Tax=Reichenbachiella agariperforans TaxID=156994 RepID=A0A1M6TF99_REIAG|nr:MULTISPECIES: NAD(P)/FAD-dependent oxidoreductase [Reichenbachiella]MBU2915414.1 NAD(P)/FAD-dependent oxidoreductase [Reichenbachiella agariperforans]RJE71518.1 NADH dehydrogenase [Reichenbachiella sp. MSK19-1]SHK55559.1 NADH dehydrogenase [Reichenbachiella agariperforans]
MSTVQTDQLEKINIPKSELPRIVIIGGGFAGLRFVKNIDSKKYQVVLLDRYNYHTFQPLLYQVATAGLEPDSIAGPLRKTFHHKKNFYFRMASAKNVNPVDKIIETNIGQLSYDHLVLACGSITNFFNNEEFEQRAFPLKQLPHALNLRSQILQNFEKAVLKNDENEVQRLMNYVIVGGGPTGVEVAGALGELKKQVLPKDFPELNLNKMQIYLIEGQDRLLGGMSQKSSEKAFGYLKKFDVNLYVGKIVESFDGETVVLNDGMRIPSETLIWAAGVNGNALTGMDTTLTRDNRYQVDEYSQVKGFDEVYAVGDVASMQSEELKRGHPMLAPVATQQAGLLAKNLNKGMEKTNWKAFKYVDKGTMATVGRNKAVTEIFGKLKYGGFLAWLTWMFVHLVLIVEFRNKLVIMSNWVWNYFTYDRGTRLIIRPFVKKKKKHVEQAEEMPV